MHVNSAGGPDSHACLWRLQQDVGADPYSLSVPHYQLGCFVSHASFTIYLWGNVGQHWMDSIQSVAHVGIAWALED